MTAPSRASLLLRLGGGLRRRSRLRLAKPRRELGTTRRRGGAHVIGPNGAGDRPFEPGCACVSALYPFLAVRDVDAAVAFYAAAFGALEERERARAPDGRQVA